MKQVPARHEHLSGPDGQLISNLRDDLWLKGTSNYLSQEHIHICTYETHLSKTFESNKNSPGLSQPSYIYECKWLAQGHTGNQDSGFPDWLNFSFPGIVLPLCFRE